MPARTKIEWADYISNPIKARHDGKQGHACVKVSEGCAHCWASTFNVRLGTGLEYNVPNMKMVEMFFDDKEFKHMKDFRPRGPFKNGRDRAVVFPCDMTDLFGDWVIDEWIDRLYALFSFRNDVDWFVLTKRPQRMEAWLCRKPLFNVYLGASIENDRRAVGRYESMARLAQSGWKTWVSYEPATGIVEWSRWGFLKGLICGGESGPRARPMHPDWARSARDFCVANGIPYFFKQWGEWVPASSLHITAGTTFKHKPIDFDGTMMYRVEKGMAGHVLDNVTWNEMPR